MEKPESRIFSEWERHFDNMPRGAPWESWTPSEDPEPNQIRNTGKATQEAAFMYERRDRLPAAHTEKRRETRNADRLINIYLAEKTRLNKAI